MERNAAYGMVILQTNLKVMHTSKIEKRCCRAQTKMPSDCCF